VGTAETGAGAKSRGVPASPTYRGVQVLRGVAACMIVLLHASENWAVATRGSDAAAWWNGTGGVDIFFVISGFVMAVSAVGKGSGGKAAWRFFERRLVRILPLYWLITTFLLVKIELGFVKSSVLQHVPLAMAICSYLLIPHWNSSGTTFPILAPGWTLSFEMFFYLCLAAALWSRKNVLVLMTVGLGFLTVAGAFRTDHWPALTVLLSPLLLEFLAGLWLGRLIQSGRGINPRLAGPLAVVALAAVWFLPLPSSHGLQRLEWGVCGMLAVYAAAVLEDRLGARIPRWSLLIGDASYSIYLSHAPLLGLYIFLLKKAHVLVPGRVRVEDEAITMLVSLVLSTVIGILVYKLVELPMNNRLRSALRLKKPVQTEAAAEV